MSLQRSETYRTRFYTYAHIVKEKKLYFHMYIPENQIISNNTRLASTRVHTPEANLEPKAYQLGRL